MDKRQDLSARIKLLETKPMEILRLKYGDGLGYKDIAAKLKMTTAEVGAVLFETLKKLDADGAASLSEDERLKILGFIHGELDHAELQSMATRIEAEEGLRKEFEAWLAVSDDIENLLAKPEVKPPGVFARPKANKFWMGASIVLVAGLALPLMKKFNGPAADNPMAVVETEDVPAPPAEAATAPGQQAVAQIAGDMNAAQNIEPAETEAEAKPVAPPPSRQFAGNPEKKMGVIASKVKVSKNLNSKKVLLALQQRLDGKQSCVPPTLAKFKTVNFTIYLAGDGSIKKMDLKPKSRPMAKCIGRMLSDKPEAFRAGKKGSSQVKVALRNF